MQPFSAELEYVYIIMKVQHKQYLPMFVHCYIVSTKNAKFWQA